METASAPSAVRADCQGQNPHTLAVANEAPIELPKIRFGNDLKSLVLHI